MAASVWSTFHRPTGALVDRQQQQAGRQSLEVVGCSSVAYLAAMFHPELEHEDLSVLDLVDHSVVPRANPPLAGTTH